MTIWDDPATDWTSGDGLRAVQLFGLAYRDVESARAAFAAVGLPWLGTYDALPAAGLWAELLRRAAGAGRSYDLAADLMHDPEKAWFGPPLRELLGDRLPRANALLGYRHGPPPDPTEKRAFLENVDMSASSPQLVEPVTTDGSLQALNQPGAGLLDQYQAYLAEDDARHRLAMIRRGGAAVGTGFLVGPDLLLTAEHVVRGDGATLPGDCAGLEAVFDFSDPRRTVAETGIPVPIASVLRYSPAAADELPYGVRIDEPGPRLDYALLRLARRVGEERRRDGTVRGFYPIDELQADLRRISLTFVYHFPLGTFLKRGWTTGPLTLSPDGNRLRYSTNTQGGSSGGLVISPDGRPVAMHHYGTERVNQGVPIWCIARAISDLLADKDHDDVRTPPAARPHLALHVRGKPVVDREGFRTRLWNAMTGDEEPRQLLVVGPADSGVSWSYRILNNVAGRAPLVPELAQRAPQGVRASRIDLRAYISTAPEHRCEALIREIVSLIPECPFVASGVERPSRFVGDFRTWCMKAFECQGRQYWLFVDSIDDIAEIARHGVDEVLTTLVDVADDEQTCLYLVFGGREADRIGHDSLRYVLPDTVSGLTREAVRKWLEERAEESGGNAAPEKVDQFLGKWFAEADPAVEPAQLSLALPDALKKVLA